jgi:hypothetical protein
VRPATIRRFLVFGVCAFGVGCLYLVPSVARSPDGISSRRSDDQPISRPSPSLKPVAVRSTGRTLPDTDESPSPGQEPTATSAKPTKITPSQSNSERDESSQHEEGSQRKTISTQDETTAHHEPTPGRQPDPSGATAFDPQQKKTDETPPDPVRNIRLGPITPDDLTVRWSASHDDTAVVGYQVWLDGFRAASTTQTQVTVNWFNDDMGQHVVQVKALDAAGNQSTSEIRLVSRPESEDSASPTESQKPTPRRKLADSETKG